MVKMKKQKEKIDLEKYLKTSGVTLIVLGFLHFLIPQYLMFSFGAILIFLGVFSLIFKVRWMLIVFGILLILLGLWNIGLTGIEGTTGFWSILGIFQIYWGIKEIRMFSKLKKENKNEKRK
jgi:uncharacterized membrane protein HdeD (DUF308 family)